MGKLSLGKDKSWNQGHPAKMGLLKRWSTLCVGSIRCERAASAQPLLAYLNISKSILHPHPYIFFLIHNQMTNKMCTVPPEGWTPRCHGPRLWRYTLEGALPYSWQTWWELRPGSTRWRQWFPVCSVLPGFVGLHLILLFCSNSESRPTQLLACRKFKYFESP